MDDPLGNRQRRPGGDPVSSQFDVAYRLSKRQIRGRIQAQSFVDCAFGSLQRREFGRGRRRSVEDRCDFLADFLLLVPISGEFTERERETVRGGLVTGKEERHEVVARLRLREDVRLDEPTRIESRSPPRASGDSLRDSAISSSMNSWRRSVPRR